MKEPPLLPPIAMKEISDGGENLKPRRIKTGAAVIMRMGWTILILRVREVPHEVELRVNVREPYRAALQETTEPLGMT